MNQSRYWNEYKELVGQTLGDFGSQTPAVLLYGLTAEVGEVFDVSAKQIIAQEDLNINRISELGDVFWYIAALELLYKLPNSLSADLIGVPFEMDPNHQLDLAPIHADLLTYVGNISHNMFTQDIDSLQFNINKVVYAVMDICIYYNINVVDCLKASINKIQKRHSNGFNKEAEKDYKAEFKATKKAIKEIGSHELLFDAKLDKRNKKNPYKGIIVKGLGSPKLFFKGDIIVDFYEASTYVRGLTKKSEEPYSVNYGPNFREYLDLIKERNNIYLGFSMDGKVISSMEIRRQQQDKNKKLVALNARALPILMNNNIKSLDDLLDYCDAVKK